MKEITSIILKVHRFSALLELGANGSGLGLETHACSRIRHCMGPTCTNPRHMHICLFSMWRVCSGQVRSLIGLTGSPMSQPSYWLVVGTGQLARWPILAPARMDCART